MSIGFAQGYSAVAIPKLKEDRGRLDVDDVSWIGSLLSVGLMAGTFLGGLLAGRLDRRWCVLVTSPVVILGWISIGLAGVTDLTWIFVGRFLTGGSVFGGQRNGSINPSSQVSGPECRFR
jgi:MFS family permease